MILRAAPLGSSGSWRLLSKGPSTQIPKAISAVQNIETPKYPTLGVVWTLGVVESPLEERRPSDGYIAAVRVPFYGARLGIHGSTQLDGTRASTLAQHELYAALTKKDLEPQGM